MPRVPMQRPDGVSGSFWDWIEENPEAAWDRMLVIVGEGADMVTASSILDVLVDHHAPAFLDRIAAAAEDPVFRELVVNVHLGDIDGPGVDAFRLLQQGIARSPENGS
jgi:hypothetical protein